jgi:hypothetical protein
MKHFLNKEFLAPNVLTVPVDAALIRERMGPYMGKLDPERFSSTSPKWDSDMRWVSAVSQDAFAEFQSLFDDLGVAAAVEPYLDIEHGVRLYSGFLVERSACEKPNFHVDWLDTNNEAFTLLTPITDNSAGFGLLYKSLDGTVHEYDYKIGEAVIMGDGFIHSTRPGKSAESVVLLSFTFGTDKMVHWEKIAHTVAKQGRMVRLPNGEFLIKEPSSRYHDPAGGAAL